MSEKRDLIEEAIEKLPEEMRTVFSLYYDIDSPLTVPEIAVALGKCPADVRELLNRAFDFLRPALEEYEPRFAAWEPTPGSLRVSGTRSVN